MADPIALVRQSIEAFNAGDWERFKAPLAPDFVYHELATGTRARGPDQNVEVSQQWKRAFPDVRGTVTNAIASGNTVALEITWEGTHSGPLQAPGGGTIPASGKRVTVPAAQITTVEGDTLKETREYFDLLGLLQQIGAAQR